MKKSTIVLILSIMLVVSIYFYSNSNSSIGNIINNLNLKPNIKISPQNNSIISTTNNTIKIANWNLQIFGTDKASNQDLLNSYAEKISDYDIIFIQEIRDNSNEAFPKLCSMLPDYNCMNSSRAGRSVSKEQYGIIIKEGIKINSFKDYNPDQEDRWERPPIEVSIGLNSHDLTIFNIHTKPDDVKNELDYLDDLPTDKNTIIIGDLNADCSYYNNTKEAEFDSWNWVIKDDEDTTVSSTKCAYDRIILTPNLNFKLIHYGIDNNITKDQSDHYLVWVELQA